MYRTKLKEILNYHRTGYKDVEVQEYNLESNTKEGLFRLIYSYERSARYDSARRYEVCDKEINEGYLDWKQHGMTISDFYGGATVD